MTRKDYQLIAGSFRATKPGCGTGAFAQWVDDCQGIAAALNNENVRFDFTKFMVACGVYGV